MVQMNSIDFTIAIAPKATSIEQDILYIKSALLYADTITLISPMASTYFSLTNEADRKSEKSIFNLVNKVMPFCQASNPTKYQEMETSLIQFRELLFSKQYKAVPMKIKLPAINALKKFSNDVSVTITEMLGNDNCTELVQLVNTGKVKLHDFQRAVSDDDYVTEFYTLLRRVVKNSNTFPLFDDQSNDL